MSPTIPTDKILSLLLRFWSHLNRRRQRQFWLVLGLMLINAFVEVVSLGSVLPFLGILVAPERVFSHPLATGFVQSLGITSAGQLVLPLTLIFILVTLVSAGVRISLLWVSTRFANATGKDFSVDIYQRTLYQPYSVHVNRNSSGMISAITRKIDTVIGALFYILVGVSSIVLLVAIMFTLIAIDPKVALVVFAAFGLSYGLITWLVRRRLKRNSQYIAQEQTKVVKVLQEGLGGIRDVLLDGTQKVYCDIYRHAEHAYRRASATNLFIGASPRYVMEAAGITLIAALAYALSNQAGGLALVVPTLGALAFGMQRLLPTLQHCYHAWSTIVGSHILLADVADLLDQPLPEEALQVDHAPINFEGAIRFDNVCFRYEDGPLVLDGLNLTIPKGVRLGIVGSTGSGKSTMLDLLMGLLSPTEGELSVNGNPIKGKRTRAWQKTIAHVPQSIYLADSTIAENIAFGVPLKDIDLERVERAARGAQIAGFIEGLQKGYNAFVGERGVRLSGGQRQRMGIARALYKDATVLVLDEATSALDNTTEQSVMEALEGLSDDLTILLIAHRLTTVQFCDIIVELERGKIVAQGTYEQLLESSPSFRAMNRPGKRKFLVNEE